MKNRNMQKKVSEIHSNKSLLSPTATVKDTQNNFTPIEWEKPYIGSKQCLMTEHGIFHFELVLKGTTVSAGKPVLAQSISRVKVCPQSIEYNGVVYDFFINPVDKVAVCRTNPKIVIKWREGSFSNPVLSLEELTPQEQFEKHKVLLENFIEKEYLPQILREFESL